jgi:hypothetical protein
VDCYTFKINDESGNGLQGTGLFKLMYGTQIFYTGKDFGFQDEVQFGVDITGIEDMTSQNTLSIFPNPARDIVNVYSDTEIEYVEIFSFDGRKIDTFQVDAKSVQINVDQYPPGVYFIRIAKATGIEIERLLIN